MKHVDMSTSTSTSISHTSSKIDDYKSSMQVTNKSVCTHVQSVSSVDVVPTVKWVIPSSQSESDATTNTLTTAE